MGAFRPYGQRLQGIMRTRYAQSSPKRHCQPRTENRHIRRFIDKQIGLIILVERNYPWGTRQRSINPLFSLRGILTGSSGAETTKKNLEETWTAVLPAMCRPRACGQ